MADYLDGAAFSNLSATQKNLIRQAGQRYIRDNKESAVGREVKDPEFNQFMARDDVKAYYDELLKGIVESRQEQSKLADQTDEFAKSLEKAVKFLKTEKSTQQTLNDLNRYNLHLLDRMTRLNDGLLRNDIKRADIEKIHKEHRQQRIRAEAAMVDLLDSQVKKAKEFYDFMGNRMKWRDKTKMLTQAEFEQWADLEEKIKDLREQKKKATTSAERKAINAQLKIEEAAYTVFNDRVTTGMYKKYQVRIKEFAGLRSGAKAAVKALQQEQQVMSDVDDQLEARLQKMKSGLLSVDGLGSGVSAMMKAMEALGTTRFGRFFDAKQISERMADASRVPGLFGSKGMAPTLNAAFEGFSGLLKSAAGRLLTLKAAFDIGAWIVESMAKADKRVTELAKSFAVSKEQARLLYENIEGQHTALNDIGVSMDDLVASQLQFNQYMGTSVVLNEKFNQLLAQSAAKMGLSEEAIKGIAQYTALSGNLSGNLRDEILGISKAEQLRHGLMLNDKQILEATLKTTGNIRANFKGQVGELAKAVTQAKMLGLSLETVDRIGESLLDWQSSIEKELNAELLTQKNLNLERARAYALQGDMVGLMGEISREVGGLDGFLKQTTLGQKAVAEAIGLSRQELADALFERKAIAEINQKLTGNLKTASKQLMEQYGDAMVTNAKFRTEYEAILKKQNITESERNRQMGELVATNLQQMDVQAKFEKSMLMIKEKIAELFGDGALLDQLADGIVTIARWLPGDSGLKTSEERALAGKQVDRENAVLQALNRKDLKAEVREELQYYLDKKGSWWSSEKLLYKDARAAFRKQFPGEEIHDGVISPKGEVVVSGPLGSIRPDPRDYLVATPNPAGLLGAGASAEQVSLLRQLIEVIKGGDRQLLTALQSGMQVSLNGQKVNESLLKGNNRM